MMLQGKKHGWLLDDSRTGNTNQIRAICSYLTDYFKIKEKKIQFGKSIILPNFCNIINNHVIHLDNLQNHNPQPDFIFSAGRRSALAAIKIKKLYSKAKIIQIMRPNLPAKFFDFIITPKYDKYINANFEIDFTPSLITPKTLKNVNSDLQRSNKHTLLVTIGGDTKYNKVSNNDIIALCKQILNLKEQFHCEILISTSRRTNKENILHINNILKDQAKLYIWSNNSQVNPYLSMLAKCDYILCSGDSISMISDALSSGKTTYVIENYFGDKKHKKFISYLKNNNLVKGSDILFTIGPEKHKYKVINEAKSCANAIIQQFVL